MKFSSLILSFLVLAGLSKPASARSFKEDQLRYDRVQYAYSRKELKLRRLFKDHGLTFPPQEIFLRVFKLDRVIEVWARNDFKEKFVRVNEYPICSSSGGLGPKRQGGDGQVPEGFYTINDFNPVSSFHLSLRVSYPNKSDHIRGVPGNLGGDIMIHGNCVTIGCIPITDDWIEELYLMAVEVQNRASAPVAVHIFPTRLDDAGMAKLEKAFPGQPQLIEFWKNLREGYQIFEKEQRVPLVWIDDKGTYRFMK